MRPGTLPIKVVPLDPPGHSPAEGELPLTTRKGQSDSGHQVDDSSRFPSLQGAETSAPPRAGGPCMKGVSQGLPSDLRPRNQHGPSVHPDNPSPILSLTGTPRTRGTSGARRKYCEYPCGLTTLAKAPVGVGSLTAAEMATGRHVEAMGARGGHKGARGGHRRDTRATGECDSHGGHLEATGGHMEVTEGHVEVTAGTWGGHGGAWRPQHGHMEVTEGHVEVTAGTCGGHGGTWRPQVGDMEATSHHARAMGARDNHNGDVCWS